MIRERVEAYPMDTYVAGHGACQAGEGAATATLED